MKRWMNLWLGFAMLGQGAHAAEIELEIAPPEPEWLLGPELSPGPCGLGGARLEACPKQLMPEGIAEIGEQSLLAEIEPLLAAGSYQAVLARIGLNYGLELVLLEAGDIDGFRRTRRPTAGGGALRPPPGARGRDVPAMNFTMDRSNVPTAGGLGDGPGGAPAGPGSGTTRGTLGPGPDTISASILYVIGHSYFSLRRYRPAEIAFRLVLDALPNHARAHESLALLYLRAERYADARTHLTRLAELGRNTAHVHSARGYLEQKTRNDWAAADAFQRALVLAPDGRSAQRGLLHALTESRQHAKARALVEQLLRAEPDDVDLWRYRAQIALWADDRAAAVASLETALRLGDDSAANREAAAALHIETGNIARAVELLRGSGARGLEFRLADQALGWLANENQWDAFRELLGSVDRAALGGVEQSRLLARRASLALRDGNRGAASAALDEALALDPANGDALVARGQIYRTDRDYGRADLLFRRASDYAAVREAALVGRAGAAIDQENYDGARVALASLVASNPARGDLRRNVEVLEDLVLLVTEP